MADTQESCTDTQESSTCTAHSRAHTQQTTLAPVALLQHIAGSYSDLYFVGKLGTRSSTSEAMRSPQRTESAKTAHTQRNMFNDGDNETINLSLLTVSSLGTSPDLAVHPKLQHTRTHFAGLNLEHGPHTHSIRRLRRSNMIDVCVR